MQKNDLKKLKRISTRIQIRWMRIQKYIAFRNIEFCRNISNEEDDNFSRESRYDLPRVQKILQNIIKNY